MMTMLKYVAELLEEGRPAAWACLQGSNAYPALKGTALFYPMGMSTLIIVVAEGLPGSGFYGLHIHEGEVCTGNDQDPFANAGVHYNPDQKEHPNHAGDLPPLLSDGGMAYLAFVTGRFMPEEVIGNTMIIHDMADDFKSQPSGNSGMKIGCGVICAHMAL